MTSKKPMNGAMYFKFLATKMIRIVPRLTSKILPTKIRTGRMTQMYTFMSRREETPINNLRTPAIRQLKASWQG